MHLLLRFTALILVLTSSVYAQKGSLQIRKATGPIIIDGKVTENDWLNADEATDFKLNFPFDTGSSSVKTVAKVCYDETFLYISAICYNNHEFMVNTMKRDFDIGGNDCFVVVIDPFKDKTNGFLFALTPRGVQREALIAEGGTFGSGINGEWDNKWISATQIDSSGWSLEMAIPFKTLRFKKDVNTWGINFARHDVKRNERSTWQPVPRMFNIQNIANEGEMTFETPVTAKGWRASVMPWGLASTNQDIENKKDVQYKFNGGFDAKAAITSSLNLDLTVNPDFSQVEADQQVTNLSRFALSFPERRTYFLENSDVFARVGFSRIRPFFSRTIGLTYSNTTKLYEQVPILYGARISGKINKKWRMSAMNMQTASMAKEQIDGQNYFVAAIQRRMFSRSNATILFVNRDRTNPYSDSSKSIGTKDYNRVLGAEYYFASKDNLITGKVFWLQSFIDKNKDDQFANASWISYNGRATNLYWNHEYVGKNFTADVGYIPRKAYWRIEQQISHNFFPKSNYLVTHGPQWYGDNYYDLSFKKLDQLSQIGYNFNFINNSYLYFRAGETYTYLTRDFDPSNTGSSVKLQDSTEYTYYSGSVQYQSTPLNNFFFYSLLDYGSYYNGRKTTFTFNGNLRVAPWGIFSVGFSLNDIVLPQPYTSKTLYLISNRIDISFSKKVFFTSFLQYNDQIKNFNTYVRLQYRFRPMSDVFLVYTNNYSTQDLSKPNETQIQFSPKNNAIVLKVVFWLNL